MLWFFFVLFVLTFTCAASCFDLSFVFLASRLLGFCFFEIVFCLCVCFRDFFSFFSGLVLFVVLLSLLSFLLQFFSFFAFTFVGFVYLSVVFLLVCGLFVFFHFRLMF